VEKEGRQVQALVDEALADLIERRKNARARISQPREIRWALQEAG
jgi:hypothetical protein